jgi:PmbA protein
LVAVLKENVLFGLAEYAVKAALKLGAAEAEAYVYEGQATSIGVELGQISKTNRIIDLGVGIRITHDKAVGFAYTNIISNPQAIEDAAKRAISSAKASKPDPNWNGLPQKQRYQTMDSTFDQQIVDLNPEDLVKVTVDMLDAAGTVDKRVFPVEGGVGSGYVAAAIANSSGVSGVDRGTIIECSLAALAKDGDAVTPVCFEFNASRSLKLNPAWVGGEAAKLAVKALKPKPIETQTAKVILTQFALQDLFSYTLMGAVKADSVQRGQSVFKDKIGMKVASPEVTIFDDGVFPAGLRSSVFDGEGVSHQKTLLIEKGILKSFLYDNYTAKKDDTESTGNSSRAGYLSTPSIDTTNFHLIPQTKTPEQLLSEVDDGFIVYYLQGAHSSNPVSGDFSVVATPCWKLKGGEVTHSCRGVMLAGNIFEMLNNISVVGANERQMGGLIAPWVVVDNVRVIGK